MKRGPLLTCAFTWASGLALGATWQQHHHHRGHHDQHREHGAL